MHKRHLGFTLIELMIVVAVIAILAAIAYPSYQEQVRRTNRTEGERTLMETAQRLERCFTEYNAYNDENCNVLDDLPLDTEHGRYEIDGDIDASEFLLTAARIGGQEGDRCGDFTLTHTGVKGITGADAGLTVADCWR
jgi:type IV pilus assembly protein PilE